jgi:DNA-binding HxlR family transcriptional regulator
VAAKSRPNIEPRDAARGQRAPTGAMGTKRCEFLKNREKKISREPDQSPSSRPIPSSTARSSAASSARPSTQTAYRCLEDVIGCKWSVSVLLALRDGLHRPGELERGIVGISTKVLNERLRKLMKYGLIARERYAELPPRTEYALTAFGAELTALIEKIRVLDRSRTG